jgi:uncharacterized protein YqeY
MRDAGDAIRERLKTDLRAAMKARDMLARDVLRALIAAIDNAGAVAFKETQARDPLRLRGRSQYVVTGAGQTEAARKPLSKHDVSALFEREAVERAAAAEDAGRHGKTEAARTLRDGVDFIENYLKGLAGSD